MKQIPVLLIALLLSFTTYAQAPISGPSTLCPGIPGTYTDATAGGTWSISSASVATIVPASGIVTPVNVGVATITYTVGSSYVTKSVTVNYPVAPISGPSILCQGTSAQYYSGIITTTGAWSSSTSTIATIGTNGIATGVSNGTVTLTYTEPTSCYSTMQVTVATALPAITGTLIACLGSNTTLSTTATGGDWTSSNASVAPVTISPGGLVSGMSVGTATITYSVATGCYSTAVITVNPLPANIIGPSRVCKGSTVTLSNTTPGGTWSSDDASVASVIPSTGIVSGIRPGACHILYTVNGCSKSNVLRVDSAALQGPSAVCVGGTLPLSVTVSPSIPSGGTWTISNPSVASISFSGAITGVSAGTTTISYITGSSGCVATKQVTVVSTPPPAVTGTLVLCTGSTTTLTNAMAGGTWTAANTGIATVGSSSGVVSGIAVGTTTISYTTGTGCTAATVNVTVYPTPGATTGPSVLCSGGTITLSNSTSGGVWASSNSSVALVTSSSGVVTGVSSGTAVITYYALSTGGCPIAHPVTVHAASPATYSVFSAGGTAYCPGAIATIGLTNSQTGVGYQVYNGSAFVGPVLWGTGAALTFAFTAAAGTYTIVASPGTSCATTMTGSVTITVHTAPASFTVNGGGNYCAGGWGLPVGLNFSLLGYDYQLYLNSSPLGSPIAGTGTAITYGLQLAGGYYYVRATDASAGCVYNAINNVLITVNPAPVAFTVTGGGIYSGGAGISIGLNGSQLGFSYQLYRNGSTLVSTIAGTGSMVSFGLFTVAGTYTVVGINATTGCVNNMRGNAIITIGSTPTVYTVTGGGTFCVGGTGVTVGLSGSQTGVSYQLYNGITAVGSPVSGTGSPISFGLQTTAGTYTVVANPGTSATAMSGSAIVVVNPAPTVYSVTPAGTYCSGSPITIGLSGSQSGYSYQLYNGPAVIGTPVTGTGSALTFGTFSTAGTYTVVVNPGTPCATVMTGSVIISTNPLPTDYPLINSGSYCSGGGGIVVALSGSDVGVSYQLYRTTSTGTVSVGSPLSGTGTPISFGAQTIAGSYTITAINTTTGCNRTLTSTVSLIFHALPALIPISGGGSYCAGGSGVAITMPASAVGVNYQLYRGTTPVGSPVAGIGAGISFGLQTVPGSYTVVATDLSTGCSRNMTGSVTVAIVPSPSAFSMTGGGGYCTGGSGVIVGINGSQPGVNYQLYRGGSPISGAVMPGSGSAISFGLQTVAGIYTAVGFNTTTFCVTNMTGSATIAINSVTTYTVTGGGTYCAGGTGVAIGLSGSSTGVNYQLRRGTTLVGTALAGTGAMISFGLQTVAGIYTVIAINPTTGCNANMAGSATITVNSVPTAYTVTGGGGYCSGSTGVVVGLSGSQTAVLYQLRIGGTPTGSPVAGTGGAISFGSKTAAGAYTVSATTVGGCTNNMTGSVTVSINPLPIVYSMGGSGSYCTGGSGIIPTLTSSQTGVNYQLLRGTTIVGSAVAGTGGSLTFGLQTVAGTYTVRATSTAGCIATMSGSTTISTLPSPTIVPVTGGGGYCAGGSGVAIGLGASVGGTSYQLYRAGTPVGSPVMGTVGLTFGLQTVAGTYTVIATNSAGCSATMSGSATVTVYPLPLDYTVTGGGNYCSGTTGVTIGLAGSNTAASYRLYRGVLPVSSPTPGTGSPLNFGLYTTTGTYNVVATNSGTGCTATMSGSAVVSVNPVPTYTSTRYTVAPAGIITLNATPSGGSWAITATSIASIGSASGIVTGVSLGTTTVSYTLPTGCRATHTLAVTPTGFRHANETPDIHENSPTSIIPNPNHGIFTIKGQIPNSGDVFIDVVNTLGQKIYSTTLASNNKEINAELSLPTDIARGMYILTLRNGCEQQTFRIIVE